MPLTWINPASLFAEYEDASLSSWVNKERFQGYLQIDGFTLYELGETGGVCFKTHLEYVPFAFFQIMFFFFKKYLIMVIMAFGSEQKSVFHFVDHSRSIQ